MKKIILSNINHLHIKNENSNTIQKIFNIIVSVQNTLSEEELNDFFKQISSSDISLSSSEISLFINIINYSNIPKHKKDTVANFLCTAGYVQNCLLIVINDKEYTNLICSSFDNILNCESNLDLIYIKDKIKYSRINQNQKEELIKKIDKKIQENPDKYIKQTFNGFYLGYVKNYEKNRLEKEAIKQKYNNIQDIIVLIVKDICKNEYVNPKDMEIIDSGSYSQVLSIGDKVIKIGKNRNTKTFPNNPYINAMILRKEFIIDYNLSVFIEVSDKVDTLSDVSEEELYEIYKGLRDIGIDWTDIDKRNVGRLKKDNVVSWRQDLPIIDKTLGLKNKVGTDIIRKKGQLVILDNDFLYDDLENKKREYTNSIYYEKFKKRYENEQKNNQQLNQMKNELDNILSKDYKEVRKWKR